MIPILIGSSKGGVGKTFVSCNLAKAMWKEGYNVALLDADIYNPCCHFYVNPKEPEEPEDLMAMKLNPYKAEDGFNFFSLIYHFPDFSVVWSGEKIRHVISSMIRNVKWDADYLIIDLPPGTGEIAQATIATIKEEKRRCKGVVVSVPHKAAVLGVKRAIDMFRIYNIEISAVVENMHDNPLFTEHIDEFCERNGYKLVKVPCIVTEDMKTNPLFEQFLTKDYDWKELVEVVVG